jgi:UDP-N-acetylglucosamine 2-epimerase (non-hydrolysing)
MKALVAFGTRPEVIKLAPVVEALRGHADLAVCATGQHREMSAQALEAFGIVPDIALDVMRPDQSLNQLAARLLAELDPVLERERPDWVLVQGDTTSAFCTGLAAFHRGIPVAHVEAGLRTGDLASPFPEEANRSLLARIVTRHFAPTRRAKQALLSEGIPEEKIVVTGNTVVDAIELVRDRWFTVTDENLADLIPRLDSKPLVLVTCHRRENFGGILEAICDLLRRLCASYPGIHWVFPVHLNPQVREPVNRLLSDIGNLSLIPPVDYVTSLRLIGRATLVVSDSGGIQEEAPSFGAPVVVMRAHTERREGIESGLATLAGQEPAGIETAVRSWLDAPERRQQLATRRNPYGDGHAADRIRASLFTRTVEEFDG